MQFCLNSVACLLCLSVIWFQAGSLQPVDLGLSSENSCPLWLEITQNPSADFEGLGCGLQKLKQKGWKTRKKTPKTPPWSLDGLLILCICRCKQCFFK